MAKQGSLFRLVVTILIFLIIVSYAVFNTRLLFKGPQISNLNIYSGQTFSDDLLEITGEATNIAFISLNGRRIFIDEDNKFRENFLLTNKLNTVEIYTEDRFGKKNTKKVSIVYTDEEGQDLDTFINKDYIDLLPRDEEDTTPEISEDENGLEV